LILYGTTPLHASGSFRPMAPLRILHVVPYYEQAWAYGGIPRLATTMTRALARRGHHVTVCTTDVRDSRTRARSQAPNAHGIDVRVFPNVSNAIAYHLQFFTPIGLRRYLRRTAASFDVAHLHACYNLPGVIAASELARAGVPYIVSPNGTAPLLERRIRAKQLFALTAGRSMLPRAARIVAVSRSEVIQLRDMGIDDSTIALIPNPVDDAEFERPVDGSGYRRRIGLGGGPVILFLGKLTPRKGIEDLVRAFASLDDPRTTLIIAGNDMGTGASIVSLIRRLGLERRVIRPGLLTGSERLDALAAADVVVYPSRDEIFGLVPLEALLAGTPVVVCNDSGCGEVISSTGGGLIVPPGDISALSAAIQTVLANADEWRQHAEAAASVVRLRFGSDVICDQLESLYRGVVTKDRVTTSDFGAPPARPPERSGASGSRERRRWGSAGAKPPGSDRMRA
jgi:glycosyltransferase involved in cell wall biosynthesis